MPECGRAPDKDVYGSALLVPSNAPVGAARAGRSGRTPSALSGRPRPLLRLLPGGAPRGSQAPRSVDRWVSVTEPVELDVLVRRAQGGDRAAFAELFRRHRSDVSRLVFRMLGPTPDAEDVVQEVFLQVHKS